MKFRKSVLAGLVMLGMALLVGTAISGGEKKEKIKGQLPPGWKNLELEKDQVIKIYTIQTSYRSKVKALEEQIKELRAQEKADMVKVLTADQKEKLRKLILGEEKKTSPKEKKSKD
jgi:hypothetical protein